MTAKDDPLSEDEGLKLGAVDYISKPIIPILVRARVKTHLELAHKRILLENLVRERTVDLYRTQKKALEAHEEVLETLDRVSGYKYPEIGSHTSRVAHYSKELAIAIGAEAGLVDDIFHSAPMHDIGMIGISDEIQKKQGKLNAEESKIMMNHTIIGANIIGEENLKSRLMNTARNIARTHHEKYDGTGYPNRLKGKNIPLPGRIVAIADIFDYLTSKRGWSVEKANAYLTEKSGEHFDPALVVAFQKIMPKIQEIIERFKEKE